MVSFCPPFVRCLLLLVSFAVLVQVSGGGAALSGQRQGQDLETALRSLCTPSGEQKPDTGAPQAHDLSCCLIHCRFDRLGSGGPAPETLVWGVTRTTGRVEFAVELIGFSAGAKIGHHQPRAPPIA